MRAGSLKWLPALPFLAPVTYEELIQITKIWVEAALKLRDRDLRMIERLVSAQNRRAARRQAGPKALEGLG